MNETLGIAHFLTQSDWAGKLVLAVLLIMSLATWYLILWKAWQCHMHRHARAAFALRFANIDSVETLKRRLATVQLSNHFILIAEAALDTCARWQQRGAHCGFELSAAENLIAATLRQKVAEAMALRERGLNLLASVASAAPFVGLFGTVWGIYHALLAIGHTGQASLDKIAGPVGEALIMTACGLAVAIPALLAYNAYVRANRCAQDEFETWTYELFALLATDRATGSATLPNAEEQRVTRFARS